MPTIFKFFSAERVSILAAISICVVLSSIQLLEGMDRFIYDLSKPSFESPLETDIALISVDNQSVKRLGRWPWTRNIHASLLSKLNEVSPRVIVLNFLFSEEERSYEIAELVKVRENLLSTRTFRLSTDEKEGDYVSGEAWLDENFISANASDTKREQYRQMQKKIVYALSAVDKEIADSLRKKSGDSALSNEIQGQTPILMPLYFQANKQGQEIDPPFILNNTATFLVQGSFSTERRNLPPNMEGISYPIPAFASNSKMLGHINLFPDADGTLRSHTLLVHHNGKLYPSLALAAAAVSIGFDQKDILFQPGGGVILGQRKYLTDEHLNILPKYFKNLNSARPFEIDSYADVLSGVTSLEKYRDKIVIVGITANGLSPSYKIPDSQFLSPSELLAFNIASLSEMQFTYTPPWSKAIIWLFFVVVAISLFFVAQYMKLRQWILLVFVLTSTSLLIQLLALKQFQIWLPLSPLFAFYIFSFLIVNLWKFSASERITYQTQNESSENNRMLGLTYQNQGQLDLAFDKFKRCKPDASIADALYGLGLDFERKRLTHKAKLVYQYIETISPTFRDVNDRIAVIDNRLPSTRALGASDTDVTVKNPVNKAILEQPTFGRYQVEKEIGRGGMGAVYLGKDPKIDRIVAIKTLDFSIDYSGSALVEAKNASTARRKP